MKNIFASILAAGFGFALNAQAITIDLVPHQVALNAGENLQVQVRISGLNAASAPSLGDYDVNLNYDASLFQFSSISWGDETLGNQLDLSGFGSLQQSDNTTAGILGLLEISFEDAANLNSLQAENFTLVNIFFNNLALGTAHFSVDVNALGDAWGNTLMVDTLNDAHVTVTGATVPEPAGWLLFSGLFAIPLIRKLRAQKA